MNERIKELAEQANELDYETFDEYNHKTVKHYKFNKEKFAELIIEECVSIVNKRKDAAIDADWLVDEAMSNAVWDIEEHFGVEE